MYREPTTQLEDSEDLVPVPKVNRFYPAPKSALAAARQMFRWASVVPNRADRRRMRYGR